MATRTNSRKKTTASSTTQSKSKSKTRTRQSGKVARKTTSSTSRKTSNRSTTTSKTSSRSATSTRSTTTTRRSTRFNAPTCPGKEALLKNTRDIPAELFRLLVTRRARQLNLDIARDSGSNSSDGGYSSYPTSENTRKTFEKKISSYYDSISRGNTPTNSNMLTLGATRVQATCRLNTPTGSGTGIMIAPGILLTTNFIVSNDDIAQRTVAEFQLASQQTSTKVALRPEMLFMTCTDSDVTIVACDTTGLENITPISMSNNPSNITRNEQLFYIQHIQGTNKQVSLQNNQVIRVKDRVMHFSSNSAPPASGTPIFNNQWQLVGIQHAGWQENKVSSINEVILTSGIVNYLNQLSTNPENMTCSMNLLMDNIQGTNPYLSIFNNTGLSNTNSLDNQLRQFTNSREFVDMGFWNLQNLNNLSNNQRIWQVANTIEDLSLDVIGMVGCQNNALDRLVSEMNTRGYAYGYQMLGNSSSALFYDKDTTYIRYRNDIQKRFSSQINSKTSTGNPAFNNSPEFIECTIGQNASSSRFMMIVVNFGVNNSSTSRSQRRLASHRLAQIIEETRMQYKMPVVLAGDYSESFYNSMLQYMTTSPDTYTINCGCRRSSTLSYFGMPTQSWINQAVCTSDVQLGNGCGDEASITQLNQQIGDFTQIAFGQVPVIMRMIYRDRPVKTPPSQPASNMEFSIPGGTRNIQLNLE